MEGERILIRSCGRGFDDGSWPQFADAPIFNTRGRGSLLPGSAASSLAAARGEIDTQASSAPRRQILRLTTSRTCLGLALSLGAGLPLWSQAASAQQITQGGGNGTGYSFGSGGLAGGGGSGDRTIGIFGGDGGSAAQTPGGSATAGTRGHDDAGGLGGAGGAPGAPNDLSAGGGEAAAAAVMIPVSPAMAERAEPAAVATSSRQPLRSPSARLMPVARERPGPLAAPKPAVAAVAVAVAASS